MMRQLPAGGHATSGNSSITYRIAIGPQQGRKAFSLRTLPPQDSQEANSARVAKAAGRDGCGRCSGYPPGTGKKVRLRAVREGGFSGKCADSVGGMCVRRAFIGWFYQRCVGYASYTPKEQRMKRKTVVNQKERSSAGI